MIVPKGPGAAGRQRTGKEIQRCADSIARRPIDHIASAWESTTGRTFRKSGAGWRGSCPVCGTTTLKVSLMETDDGRVLLHAFCGHAPHELLAAIGCNMADLFPHRDLRQLSREERRALRAQYRATKVLAAMPVLTEEATVTLIAANTMADGNALSEADHHRLTQACVRLWDALEVCHGQ